jgi:predicted MFS family arabinose efflux permease
VHAVASCILSPAIAALTLALCGHDAFSERLGINARYASLGNASAAALLGAIAFYFSERAVFVTVALLTIPAIMTLPLFRNSDRVEETDHPSLLHPKERRQRNQQPWHIFMEPALLVFGFCAVLFSLANAAMLPLALNELAKRTGQSGFVVSACIIVPQAIVALCSPWAGRMAQQLGRRPVLLIGFAALPLRAILFVGLPDALPLVVIETLDGISGTVFGLMVPLIAADVTKRSGFLNLAISSINLAVGLGATISTTLAGWLADAVGAPMAFFCLAVIGLCALLVVWSSMPETRPRRPLADATASAVAR